MYTKVSVFSQATVRGIHTNKTKSCTLLATHTHEIWPPQAVPLLTSYETFGAVYSKTRIDKSPSVAAAALLVRNIE